MADIAIIDYGMGNVHSVYKALNKVIDKIEKKISPHKIFIEKLDSLI